MLPLVYPLRMYAQNLSMLAVYHFFLQLTLCLPWEDQQLLSEPVVLPTRQGEKSKDGKEKDHPTPLKVVLCNNKSSTNQVY